MMNDILKRLDEIDDDSYKTTTPHNVLALIKESRETIHKLRSDNDFIIDALKDALSRLTNRTCTSDEADHRYALTQAINAYERFHGSSYRV